MNIELGKKISVQLSEALKCMLTGDDFEDVARRYGRSGRGVRQLVYRQYPVVEGTLPILVDLTKTAIKVANKHGKTLTKYA